VIGGPDFKDISAPIISGRYPRACSKSLTAYNLRFQRLEVLLEDGLNLSAPKHL